MRIGLIVSIAVGVVVAVLLPMAARRARRRREAEVPELNKHPERLEQMLDSTDDA
jgi:membrane protein implicated in regulation of membrane protease activity